MRRFYAFHTAFLLCLLLLASTKQRVLQAQQLVQTHLYVSSWGTNKIQRFNGAGEFAGTHGQDGGLFLPTGLSFGADGHLYVCSHSFDGSGVDGVLRYDGTTGEFIDVFVEDAARLSNVQDCVFSPHNGDLYVSSFDTSSVVRFDRFTGAFVEIATDFPTFWGPRDVVFSPHDGNLYVGSVFFSEVLIFDRNTGAFIDDFASGGGLENPVGMEFGPDGHFYIASFDTHEIKRYDGVEGFFLGDFVLAESGGLLNPNGLTFGPGGDLFVSSFGTHEVKRYDGVTGEFLGDFIPQSGLCFPTSLVFNSTVLAPLVSAQQFEATLAGGTARFRWFNPAPLDEVFIFDAEDNLIAELDGSTSFFELPTNGSDAVSIKVQGVAFGNLSTRAVGVTAVRRQCLAARPPLVGSGLIDQDVEFYSFGEHAPAPILRCALPLVGQGAGPAGPGAEVFLGSGVESAVGQVLVDSLTDLLIDKNKIATGFRLETPADRLEIRMLYSQLDTTFGLELRGLLTRVFPQNDADAGFHDEFTFPEIIIDPEKRWVSLTYFRADQDIGDPSAIACGLQIPPGEYRLDIYAVGGVREKAYFATAADAREDDIFIPGVPCAPYPMVELRDQTGLPSLPNVTKIEGQHLGGCFLPFFFKGKIQAQFTAHGTWFDEDNNQFRIDPSDIFCSGCAPECPPYQENPNFEYTWKIHDREPPLVICSGTSNSVTACLRDFGCFKVELEVKDLRCETSRSFVREVPIYPEVKPTDCVSDKLNTFLFPTPDPKDIFAIAGLDPAPGGGRFEGKRPLELRILVVPRCFCEGKPPSECAAASIDVENYPANSDILFRLAVPFVPNGGDLIYFDLGAEIEIEDLCPNITIGPKFYLIRVPDLGAIAPNLALEDFQFRKVFLQGTTVRQNGTGIPIEESFQNVAQFSMANAPGVLSASHWTGSFDEEEAVYRFDVNSGADGQITLDLGSSDPVPFDLPVDVGIPAYPSNFLSTGFSARFVARRDKWEAQLGLGNSTGDVLGNKLDLAPLAIEPVELPGGGAGDGGGAALPAYEWCSQKTILDSRFSQKLFESILYTGFIGPVPVTVRASIGLALSLKMNSEVVTRVAPFGGLSDASTFFNIDSKVGLSIPAEVRADILFGVASFSGRMVPESNFVLRTQVGSVGLGEQFDRYARADLGLRLEAKACVSFVFTDICYSQSTSLFSNFIFYEAGTNFTLESCAGGGGGGDEADVDPLPRAGAGGGVVTFFVETTPPATASTPGGKYIDVEVNEFGAAMGQVDNFPLAFAGGGSLIDPTTVFLTESLALVAWGGSFESLPGESLAEINTAARGQNIYLYAVEETGPLWNLSSPIAVSDDPALVPLADRRADGRPSIARLSPTRALVAWVRYLDDFLIDDGFKTVILPAEQDDTACDGKAFCERVVLNRRPQLEKTAIFIREVDKTGPVAPPERISPDGINIEPVVAVSPSGNASYVVWVHDSTPGHKDLIESNLGRRLLFSRRIGAGPWEPAADVVALPNDFPGILEPYIALTSDDDGLAAFTAVGKASSIKDTALGGGNRFVYLARLVDGVFLEPVLVRGRCQTPVYGHWVEIKLPEVSEVFDPFENLFLTNPIELILFQETGAPGSPEGSGSLRVAARGPGMASFGPAIDLTPDDNLHFNITGTVSGNTLHVRHLDGGPAQFDAQAGAGGGLGSRPVFQTLEFTLDPDPTIVSCTLSDPFAGPGALVTATVVIENQGLAGTPVEAGPERLSPLRLRLFHVEEDGTEREVEVRTIGELMPGETTQFAIELEVPHDPVRLRAEISPSPRDRDYANNTRECFFGAPSPRDVGCELVVSSGEDADPMLRLSWSNTALYDRVFVYRDGSMLASLPGSATAFLDADAPFGLRTYALRGCLSRSKSARAECSIDFQPIAGTLFVRGDANSDGRVNIADPSFIANFVFGIPPATVPPCLAAADANGDGRVNIADPSYVANFVFGIGPATPPPAPHPDCGESPEETLSCDESPACAR